MYIEEYKASISRNNDNTLAFNNLGTVYDKQGLYDLAIEAYTNALTNNHYFPLTHNNLGIAYAMKDLYADAMDEMDLAIKYNANDYSAYRDLGLLYFKYKKDAQKSLYYLNESLRLAPNPTEAKKVKEIIQAISTGQNF